MLENNSPSYGNDAVHAGIRLNVRTLCSCFICFCQLQYFIYELDYMLLEVSS